jgi:hypothetical protein
VALAVTLAVAVALAGTLAVQRRTAPEHEDAVRAVDRYTAAWNTRDPDAVLRAMTYEGTFTAGDSLARPLIGPLHRDELPQFLRRLMAASVSLRTTGEPEVVGSGPWRVAVRQTVHYEVRGVPVDEEALSLFVVVVDDGRPTVRNHVWWRPQTPLPSMRWAE